MNERFYNINLFRVWFTLTIIYGHIIQHWMMPQFGKMPFFTNLYRHTSYAFGYMCEAFFVISGFFMFYTFLKKPSFQRMIISKIARLWPVVVFSLFCFLLLSLFGMVKFQKYGNILAVFFLNSALTPVYFNDGAGWYVNSLFWGYFFYFCLDKIVVSNIKIYVFSVVTFLFYSILLNKVQLYDQPQIFCGILSIPLVRALAGMGAGYIIGYAYNNKEFYVKQRILFTILEIFAVYLLFRISIIKKIDCSFQIMIVSFVILFVDFVFKAGLLSKIANKKMFDVFGRYCFSAYMMQGIGFHIANKFMWNNTKYGVQEYPLVKYMLLYLVMRSTGRDYLSCRRNSGKELYFKEI